MPIFELNVQMLNYSSDIQKTYISKFIELPKKELLLEEMNDFFPKNRYHLSREENYYFIKIFKRDDDISLMLSENSIEYTDFWSGNDTLKNIVYKKKVSNIALHQRFTDFTQFIDGHDIALTSKDLK